MLDKDTVERIARDRYDVKYDTTSIFSDEFRCPILQRGYLLKDELIEIVGWKAPRRKTNAPRNDPLLVEDVTRLAFAADDPRFAAWMLCYLEGVWVRMASAILTVYDPRKYTVMDVRAWATLERMGLPKLGLSPDMDLNYCDTYGSYLSACKCLASRLGVSLRTLDRCLWALNGELPEELGW